jgi:hypothetical protein
MCQEDRRLDNKIGKAVAVEICSLRLSAIEINLTSERKCASALISHNNDVVVGAGDDCVEPLIFI